MFQNNLKISIRRLFGNKLYAAINLLGLSLGLASVIMIGLFIQFELSFDRFHEKGDRVYRLASQTEGASFENGIAKVHGPWGPTAMAQIPEVEDMTRFLPYGQALVSREEKRFYESGGFYVDASIFNMFSFELLKGDRANALEAPNSIVINEELAQKYFGDADPVGLSLTFENEREYQVKGVLKKVPDNAHFNFRFLVSMSTYEHPEMDSWVRWNQFYTYLLLQPGSSSTMVAKKFDAILADHVDEQLSASTTPLLQPLFDIHLHSNLFREITANADIRYIYIFGCIALFILLIACVNFINLSTARAITRAKEVGVRKVIGATKGKLIYQFMGESFFFTILAGGMALVLAYYVLPAVNALLGLSLGLNFLTNPMLFLGLAAILLAVGLFAGAYPALVLASFHPAKVLKGRVGKIGGVNLRRALVVVQFAIAGFLIVSTLVVNGQVKFIRQKHLGFNKEQIINIPIRTAEARQKISLFKSTLKALPGVIEVSASANRPGGSDFGIPYVAEGVPADAQPPARLLVVDHDFVKTYGMEIVAGRDFSEAFATDSTAYLINETAAKQLGWSDPLAHYMSMPAINRPKAPVVGVIKDFHFRSLHEEISPLVVIIQPDWFTGFSVKLEAANLEEALAAIEVKWKTFEPNHPFSYQFFDQSYEALYQSEQQTSLLIQWLTLIAILITCLGLFGLSTYNAVRRTKEIGIRKVLGASVSQIFTLMSKEVILLVVLSLVFALPLVWWASQKWLESFAYRMDIDASLMFKAAVIALLIAILTVGYHSIKTALSNPVKALRTE
ncbi:MAG: ABC transporter permease [Saprospiraceae bacterium]